MCMEDIRIMRRTVTAEHQIECASGVARLMLPVNERRVALIVGSNVQSNLNITMQATPTSTVGLGLQTNYPPLILTLLQHGDLVRREFQILARNSACTVTVWEVSLQE